MNTHLLDLLSLNWKVEFFTSPDLSIQVIARKLVHDFPVKAEARMSAAEVTDPYMQDFFWKKFFRLCMFKTSYYSRHDTGFSRLQFAPRYLLFACCSLKNKKHSYTECFCKT